MTKGKTVMSIREQARLKAKMAYLQRLEKLNVGAEDITVLDSIDRPMRQLIVEMHRIGMQTTFSCCGFTYEGEEEPKTHHANFTYVFIKAVVNGNLAADNMSKFLNQLVMPGHKPSWKTSPFQTATGTPLIHLYYDNPLKGMYESDGLSESIHCYEPRVMAIRHAYRVAKSLPTAVEQIHIRDGNHEYFEAGISEWQVEPKPDYVHNIMRGVTINE